MVEERGQAHVAESRIDGGFVSVGREGDDAEVSSDGNALLGGDGATPTPGVAAPFCQSVAREAMPGVATLAIAVVTETC